MLKKELLLQIRKNWIKTISNSMISFWLQNNQFTSYLNENYCYKFFFHNLNISKIAGFCNNDFFHLEEAAFFSYVTSYSTENRLDGRTMNLLIQ